jgi:hypothetical protein
MPGLAVHGPLILTFSSVGFLLCWPHPVLRPALIVWFIAGLYLSRDVAILCHYAPLLTLISWGVSIVVLVKSASIARFGVSHTVIPAIFSVALTCVLCVVAFVVTRGLNSSAVSPRSDGSYPQ